MWKNLANNKSSWAIILLFLGLGLPLFLHLEGCFTFDEEHRLYLLSPSTQELHVLNARDFSPVLTQPMDLSAYGALKSLQMNILLHQLLVPGDKLARVGTESPFELTLLADTSYTGNLITALPNAFYEANLVLTDTQLLNIDAYGAIITGDLATGEDISTPTPTPTPTPAPVAQRRRETGLNAATLSSTCTFDVGGEIVGDLALNSITVFDPAGEFLPQPSASATAAATAAATASTNDITEAPPSLHNFRFFGGNVALVACGGSDQVLVYNTLNLSLISSITLATGAAPMKAAFLQTPDEKADSVTGRFVVWTSIGTIYLVSTSGSLVSTTPITVSSNATITVTDLNLFNRLIITGYFDNTTNEGFIDVRDFDGDPIEGSPFVLPTECTGGPHGVYAEVIVADGEEDVGQISDTFAWYTCSGSGLIGIHSGNLGDTFLRRELGDGTEPAQIIANPETNDLYVLMRGSTLPAPGVIALHRDSLSDAFSPPAVTFQSGIPEGYFLIP